MITRVSPRHRRGCVCGHPCHQSGPYQPVRWCNRCLRPIRRGHKYRRAGRGFEHKVCAWPSCGQTPDAYLARNGRAVFEQMRDLLWPGYVETERAS